MIYGSSGHGRFARAIPHDDDRWGYSNEIFQSPEPETEARYLKSKQYELKDHLGNVRVVLNDFKTSVVSTDSAAPYNAVVLAVYNYYPFGMLQQGLYSENSTTYRFGFNGMMRMDDVKDLNITAPLPNEGVGNTYATQFRQYDPRTTRWFSLDPLRAKFPWTSPYVGMGNNPVLFVDPFGMEVEVGGNTEFAGEVMVKGLVDPEYQNRISIVDNKVSFDVTGLNPGLFDECSPDFNSGVTLLNNLLITTNRYMFYGIDKDNVDIPILNNEGKQVDKGNVLNTDIYSVSSEPKYRDFYNGTITVDETYKTTNGFSAVFGLNTKASYQENIRVTEQVSIFGFKLWSITNLRNVSKPLLSVVFHEGWELWDRTDNKNVYDYTINGKEINSPLGAHNKSVFYENWFWMKSQVPGVVTSREVSK